jgi:hypothetical protein
MSNKECINGRFTGYVIYSSLKADENNEEAIG